MRTAILSDIHGNLTALEAVLRDIRRCGVDRILHGGDLADSGSSPAEVVDLLRAHSIDGVAGNTDELLSRPASLEEAAERMPALLPLCAPIAEMAAASRELLGDERVAWLASMPSELVSDQFTLVHASPGDLWRSPRPEDPDTAFLAAFGSLGAATVVYGHTHIPHLRTLPSCCVANSGSVGMPLDGDPRAGWLLFEDAQLTTVRIEYDVNAEIQRRKRSPIPHADWIVRTLGSGRPQLP